MSASLINAGLSRSNLERFWPLWLCFAVAWLLGLILPIAIMVPAVGDQAVNLMQVGWTAEYVASLFGCAVGSIASVCFVFEYLFNQPSAIFHGSLPIKRSSLFISTYVSGLLPLLAIEVVVAFVLMVFSGIYPVVEAVSVWCWLGLTVGFTFIFYSLAAFCAVLTGERSMTISLFTLANFFIVFVEGFLRVIASMTLWGVSMFDTFKTMWTSPFVGLWNYCINGGETVIVASDINFMALVAYCLVAAVLLVLAVMLNNRRNFECAGSTAAFKGVRVFCKYVAGISGALFCGLLVLFFVGVSGGETEGVLSAGRMSLIAAFMAIGGFLGLFFAEVALGKSMRVLGKCWKGAVILAVLSIAFVAGCSMDVLHIQSYVPKASDVKSVQLSNGVKLEQEESIELAVSSHQKVLDYGWHSCDSTYENQSQSLEYRYTLKNGTVVSRSYTVYVTSNAGSNVVAEGKRVVSDYQAVLNSKEGLNSRFGKFADKPAGTVSITVNKAASNEEEGFEVTHLNAADVQEFVSGPLMKDVSEHGLGTVDLGLRYLGNDEEKGSIEPSIGYIELDLVSDASDGSNFSIELTKGNCPNVAKWLKEYYKIDLG